MAERIMAQKTTDTEKQKEYSGFALRENLNKLMDECKINMSQLHRHTGVPIGTIQRMRNDPEPNPTISSLKPIADFFNVTVNQLIGDEALPVNRLIGAYVEKENSWENVPIISWQQAITWPNAKLENPIFVKTDAEIPTSSFALKVEEENWDGFLKNTILIVAFNLKPEHRDYIITHKQGENSVSLKQLIIYEGISYLKPPNREFKTSVLDSTYDVIGVVVQTKMNHKLTK